MEERKSWERMTEEGEPVKWFSRFNCFRLMKPWERSINAVFTEEQSKNPKKPEKTRTKSDKEWYQKAREWRWEERAAAYDKSMLDERDKQIAAEEADVWRRGLAVRHERVKELESKARLIEQSWQGPEGTENAGKVIFQWLTPDKIREWRGCLEDIAKIKGEHKVRQELTGKDGAPLGLVGLYDPKENEPIQLPKKDEES